MDHDARIELALHAKLDKILAQHEALRTTNRELSLENKRLKARLRKLAPTHRTTIARRAKKGTP